MQDKDRIIAQQTTGGRIATEEGYARLEMLMRGNEEERQEEEKFQLWYLVAIAAVLIVIAFNQGRSNKRANAFMLDSIETYIRQTYGDELDIFDRQEINPYTLESGNSSLSQRFIHKDNGCYFYITADTDGNITYDGYQEMYLTGGSVYKCFDNMYWEKYKSISSQFYKYATENGYMTMLDNCHVGVHFENMNTDMLGQKYIGPYLDPTADYDLDRHDSVDELAAQYGYITVKLNTVSDDLQTFERLVNFFRDFINSRDVVYNHVNIIMDPKADIQENYKVTLTYDEITSPDFTAILAEKLAVYAQD